MKENSDVYKLWAKRASKFEPISIIHIFQTPGWHLQAHLQQKSTCQRGQISWYSSVQSSSTFRYRLAYKPLYIFKCKKIEQGQLSYPKICPYYFSYSNSNQGAKLKDTLS